MAQFGETRAFQLSLRPRPVYSISKQSLSGESVSWHRLERTVAQVYCVWTVSYYRIRGLKARWGGGDVAAISLLALEYICDGLRGKLAGVKSALNSCSHTHNKGENFPAEEPSFTPGAKLTGGSQLTACGAQTLCWRIVQSAAAVIPSFVLFCFADFQRL